MMKRIVILSLVTLCSAISLSAQIKVVGHRGCRFNTPDQPESPLFENTIASLKFAQKTGIDAVEFDVQLTADEKVIVFHGKTVPGLNKNIQTITFDQARAVVLPGGHRMPTLEEWFKQAKKCPDIPVIVEIKPQETSARETKLVELVFEAARKMNMGKQLEFTTFSEWACAEIHRIDKDAKVLFLDSGVYVKTPEYCAEKGYNGISYDMNGFMNHPEYIERAKKLGIETTLWIVNDYEVVQWAILHGIDCVSSDHPEMVKAYVDSVKPYINK